MRMRAKDGKPVVEFQKRELDITDAFLGGVIGSLALIAPYTERCNEIVEQVKALLDEAQGKSE